MTLTVSHSVQSLEKRGDCTEFPIRPTQKHWERLRDADPEPELLPDEFVARWQVSQSGLAEICDCSVKTVERWFQGLSKPKHWHRHRLAVVDAIWRKIS